MIKGKKILAIETSGELCSVALHFDFNIYDERNILMKHIHSEKLVPIINDLLKSNGLKTSELDIVAVSNGPGSFTGLRIGMTAAKAIAFASNLPLLQVPTLDALSLEINEFIPPKMGFCIINNANIDECYFARYESADKVAEVKTKAELMQKSRINEAIIIGDLLFGNIKAVDGIKNISSPRASSIGKWTYLFGEDLLTFEYDYLEPNYLKHFKVRPKK